MGCLQTLASEGRAWTPKILPLVGHVESAWCSTGWHPPLSPKGLLSFSLAKPPTPSFSKGSGRNSMPLEDIPAHC